MKLATFVHEGRQSFGVACAGGICDIPSLWADGPHTVLEALQGGPGSLDRIAAIAAKASGVIPTEDVRLLTPVPDARKVIGLAGNYVKHIAESGKDTGLSVTPSLDTTPRPFIMPATVLIGPDAEIPWPAFSRQIDYEIELAVVIGSPARCVQPDAAARCIAGYSIANDVSARTVTFAENRSERPPWDEFYDWLNGKWADGFCPVGPYLVTADEIGDPGDLELQLTVNGQVRQKARTSEMIFNVYEIVSFISHVMTLLPGDIIATGTPHGVGVATGNLLESGDVITCRIEKIGQLTNTLGAPRRDFYTPCQR